MIDKYFWIIVILVTSVNGLIWWIKSKKYIAENPELEEGYKRLIKVFLLYGNIPWLILGLFVLTGSIRSPFEILEPSNLNLGVILWHLSVIGILGLGTYWIFFNNGAETLEKYPGLFQSSLNRDGKVSAGTIKFFGYLD